MNIRLKLTAYTLGIVLAVGSLLTLFSVFEGRRRILSTFEKECRKTIELVSRNIANDVYSLEAASLDQQLENIRINPDFSFIWVTDPEGEVLSDGTKENQMKGKKLKGHFSDLVFKAPDWISQTDSHYLKIGGPIRMPDGGIAGYLVAAFNLDRAFGIVRYTTRINIYLSALCFAVGALLAFFLSRSFTQPLRELLKGTEEIRQGHLKAQVHLNRSDELGQLASSFNQMASNLERTSTERRAAQDQLLHSLQEKEVLLKEIHHRVKNNLQIISSLLRLQWRDLKDPQAKEALLESQNRIQSMAFLHQQLYITKDFTHIDFSNYVELIGQHLFHSYGVDPKRITFHNLIENLFLDFDLAIPCGLVLHELISNALKHAFPGDRTGKIEVGFHDNTEGYELTVKDNGVGLPAGYEEGHSATLGLKLVTSLAGQLQGTLICSREEGTLFKVRFPKILTP